MLDGRRDVAAHDDTVGNGLRGKAFVHYPFAVGIADECHHRDAADYRPRGLLGRRYKLKEPFHFSMPLLLEPRAAITASPFLSSCRETAGQADSREAEG